MKEVRRFIAALFRHWLLVLSGPLLSGVLSILERYTRVSIEFRLYVAIVSTGVLVALYRTWLDEHRLRTAAEERVDLSRPGVVLTISGEFDTNASPFIFRNTGASSAFNLRVLPIALGDHVLDFDEVADLAGGTDTRAVVSVRGSAPFWARDVLKFFEQGYEAVVDRQFVPRDETELANEESAKVREYFAARMGLSEMVVPFAIEYRDLGGTEYVTQQHFIYEVIVERLAVRLVASTRKVVTPALPAAFVIPGTREERRLRQ